MNIDTKFYFVLFCVVFEEILCSESVAAEKTTSFCLEFTFFFSFVYFLYVGIPILKIVLLYAHKWVIPDVFLLKLSFLLSRALLGGGGGGGGVQAR